jgi:hypothetical protein
MHLRKTLKIYTIESSASLIDKWTIGQPHQLIMEDQTMLNLDIVNEGWVLIKGVWIEANV